MRNSNCALPQRECRELYTRSQKQIQPFIRTIRTRTSPSPVKAHSKSKERSFLVFNVAQKGNHGENRMRFSPQQPRYLYYLSCVGDQRKPAATAGL